MSAGRLEKERVEKHRQVRPSQPELLKTDREKRAQRAGGGYRPGELPLPLCPRRVQSGAGASKSTRV